MRKRRGRWERALRLGLGLGLDIGTSLGRAYDLGLGNGMGKLFWNRDGIAGLLGCL